MKNGMKVFWFITLLFWGTLQIQAQCDCIGATGKIRGSRFRTAYDDLKNSYAVFIGTIQQIKKIEDVADGGGAEGS